VVALPCSYVQEVDSGIPTGIIGATGFIGSYLCRYAADAQTPLRIFTRSAAKVSSPLAAEIQQGDLLSRADCERFVCGLDVIYYLAHTHTPFNSDVDQAADAELNLVPFLTLLGAIRRVGGKPHIVYFGSGGAVYAPNPKRIPFRECDPCAPTTSYGILKIAAEHYLRLAADRGELTATVLRVANAYGTLLPQYRTQGLIGVALNQLLHEEPVRLFGNPENVRDYVHLQDVMTMASKASAPRRPFDVVNVGSGRGHSVADVLAVIRECHGSPFPIHMDEDCARWLSDWVVLDGSYAHREYSWTPAVSLRAGITAMLAGSRRASTAVA
jgi:UDP-glucose 4-epimerase